VVHQRTESFKRSTIFRRLGDHAGEFRVLRVIKVFRREN